VPDSSDHGVVILSCPDYQRFSSGTESSAFVDIIFHKILKNIQKIHKYLKFINPCGHSCPLFFGFLMRFPVRSTIFIDGADVSIIPPGGMDQVVLDESEN
jgi:hypothetical protein